MPNGSNYGDPNVWTTYTGGVMQLTLADGVTATSPNIVLTTMNQVQFCGNFTVPSTASYPLAVATVPEALRPDEAQYLLVPALYSVTGGSSVMGAEFVEVSPEGAVTVTGNHLMALDAAVWTVVTDEETGSQSLVSAATLTTVYLDSVSYDLASVHYGSYNPS